jgi:hypothetical protein
MTTAYTSLLGLALPVTGELSGTWGDVVNNSITSLVDSSVAGTTNISADSNVTLTTTTGASNEARQAILLFSGARTAVRTVTAPAQSKIYTVINATTGGYAVTLVGAGPTTGVTIANGARTVVAWNGSDFVEVSSPSSIILPGGTANGVLYLNGSKVVTSGSALTFDGTTFVAPLTSLSGNGVVLTVDRTGTGGNDRTNVQFSNSGTVRGGIGTVGASDGIYFNQGTTEGMRLTSAGLIIGGTSGGERLNLENSGSSSAGMQMKQTGTNGRTYFVGSTGSGYPNGAGSLAFYDVTAGAERMTINSSGNLGLGNTPNSWGGGYVAFQVSSSKHNLAATTAGAGNLALSFNAFFDTTDNRWEYIYTGDPATQYSTSSGQHRWYNAPSGTAGNAITFTQAMTLTASSELLVNRTSASGLGKLNVEGGADFTAGNVYVGRDSGNLLVGDTTAAYSAKLYANGIIAARNGGVDGVFQNAFIAGYSSNYNEINAIQSAVSSGGTLSGWRFQASVGGGSGTTYKTLDSLRDVTIFYTQDTERARIDSSGGLRINTTSYISGGSEKLTVTSTGDTAFFQCTAGSGGGTSTHMNRSVTSGNFVYFTYTGSFTPVGSISTNGSTTAFNTSSDYRLKNTIAPMIGALAKVALLKPCTYKWNADGSNGEGFIAHELAEVVPQCVTGEKDAVNEDGSIKPQGIDTSFLVATLTAALQELNAKFDAYVASHP